MKNWKQTKWPIAGGLLHKLRYILTVEYSGIGKVIILTWKDLQDIDLRNQKQVSKQKEA